MITAVVLSLALVTASFGTGSQNPSATPDNWRTKIPAGMVVEPLTGMIIDELLTIFPDTPVEEYGWRESQQVRDVNLPGESYGKFELVAGCERRSRVGAADDSYGIAVLICKQNVQRISAIAKGSANALKDIATKLGASPTDSNSGSLMMPKNGWRYVHESLEDQSDFYFIPAVVVSHGVFTGYSAVLIDKSKRRAVIAQTEVGDFCKQKKNEQSQLCTHLESVLRRLVIAIASRTDAERTR